MSTRPPLSADPAALLADLGWLRRLAHTLVRDPHLADDLVQQTCELALRRDEPPREPRAWLTTVLRNLKKAHARREAARQRREQARQLGVADDAAALMQRAEAQQALVAAVLQLDEPYRPTVLLRWFDGLPPRCIARRLGVPVATVNSRLQRALQQLRQRLDHDFGPRSSWLLGFLTAPLPASPSLVLPTLILMQTKMKLAVVAAAVAAVACTAPLWWPSGSVADASVGLVPENVAPRGGGHGEGGGGGSGEPASTGGRERRLASAPRASTPASEAATHSIRGRVTDCSGLGLADVRIGVAGGDAAGTSDAAGNFQLTTTATDAALSSIDDDYVTVLAGDWSEHSTIAPVVVVARAVSLAGSVVEASGAPVAGARVQFVLPDDFDSRFSVPLDRAGEHGWSVVADNAGAFAFARLPAVDGAELLVAADAFAPTRVPQPQIDDTNLQVVLHRFHYEDGELTGRVLDPAGAPAPGARVAMGVTSVVADEDGRFGISLRRAGWPTAIVAAKAGYLPGRLEVPNNGGKRREDWGEELVLRLGPAPQTVSGRVVDQDGEGIAGAEVWIADPTPFGIAAVMPLQLEYVIAGGIVPPHIATMRVPMADDPTQEGNFTTQASVPTASAGWFYVTTDEGGGFVLPGLLDRAYELKALDPRTGLFGEVAGVTGGSWQEIRIARDAVWPELRGRVVSLSGAPVAGVHVEQSVAAHQVEARVPGGRFAGTALRSGAATTTGADGEFVLRDVGRRHASFALSGDAIVPTHVDADAITDPLRCRFEVEARCHVEVVLFDAAEADQVRCLDGNGEPLEIAVLRRNSNHFTSELPLHDGRSGLFVVGERAAVLQLMRQDTVVRRITLTPDPTKTTTVH